MRLLFEGGPLCRFYRISLNFIYRAAPATSANRSTPYMYALHSLKLGRGETSSRNEPSETLLQNIPRPIENYLWNAYGKKDTRKGKI